MGEAAATGGAPVWKRKARRLVALLLLMGALAVYLDRDLQRQLVRGAGWWCWAAGSSLMWSTPG